ncbi:hypothetical protein [Streptomyces sp. NPDC001604]|uniref:hypothetical protein n=1 Tax=Streptomyces sp. NPDC001604 TaxID=3364593 RepID=UPI0036AD030F
MTSRQNHDTATTERTARRKRVVRAVSIAAIGLAVTAGATTTTSAASKYSNCSSRGGILSIGTEYNFASQNTVWVTNASFTIERNGGHHNNVYLRLRKGDGTDVWAWTSQDDVWGGQTKTRTVSKRVPRSSRPYLKGHATFDVTGRDPSCAAYIKY